MQPGESDTELPLPAPQIDTGLRRLRAVLFVIAAVSSWQLYRAAASWYAPTDPGAVYGMVYTLLAWTAFAAGVTRQWRAFVLLTLAGQFFSLPICACLVLRGCLSEYLFVVHFQSNVWNLGVGLMNLAIVWYLVRHHVRVVTGKESSAA
ncbi:MAG: hypothetical protein HY902_05120 [Deltaproteobacteria bacterium]|nr:hypothetical protein [Deltaproteobacteria bacterium]